MQQSLSAQFHSAFTCLHCIHQVLHLSGRLVLCTSCFTSKANCISLYLTLVYMSNINYVFAHAHSSHSCSHLIDNTEPGKERYFRKLSTSRAISLGTPYDAVSIMHYRGWSFSANGGRTLQSKHGIPLGGPELSPTDVKQARLLYNCPAGKVYCCLYAYLTMH